MKKLVPIVIVMCLVAAILGGSFVAYRYMPSSEQADIGKLLGVQGQESALYFNQEKQDAVGLVKSGQTYLPLTWVNEYVNEKFYWDDTEKLLVYTLPDMVVYANTQTLGSSGQPMILEEDGAIYLSVNLVGSYTDLRIETHDSKEYNRVFVEDRWEEKTMGVAGRETPVREKGGIKSPVITTVEKGGAFQILETMEEWSKVRTQDGFIGYLPNKRIESTQRQQDVSTFVEPEYTSISLGEPVVMVWHQVFSDAANNAFGQMIANTSGVNVVAPTWFMLTDNEGNYQSLASHSYVQQAHSLGMQVWAVLDNFNMGDNVNSEKLFSRTSVRKQLIENLMADIETYDIDGINLDIESIKPEAGPHYVQFIRELSVACRNQGVILSVDNYVPSAYTAFYNRAEQGRVADYVIIMGYDEHYAGGEAGSVASLPYVRKGIQDTLASVPKEKVINAVPFYTRLWTEKDGVVTSTALGMSAAKQWAADNQVELYWQEELGQYYGSIQTEQGFTEIWQEDERSLELKMDLIRDHGLGGVACWKLGFEPASIWEIITME